MLTDILNVQRHEGIDVSVILCISGMVNSLYAAGLTYEKSIGETSESMTTAFYELLFSGTNKTSFAFIGKKINFDIDSEKSIQKFFHTQIF